MWRTGQTAGGQIQQKAGAPPEGWGQTLLARNLRPHESQSGVVMLGEVGQGLGE